MQQESIAINGDQVSQLLPTEKRVLMGNIFRVYRVVIYNFDSVVSDGDRVTLSRVSTDDFLAQLISGCWPVTTRRSECVRTRCRVLRGTA